jgi:hypothetical protein
VCASTLLGQAAFDGLSRIDGSLGSFTSPSENTCTLDLLAVRSGAGVEPTQRRVAPPLGRYVLINLAFLGMGLAACTAVVAGLIWMLS